MTFAAPSFLAALAALPLAAAAYYLVRQRRRRYAVRFPGVPTLAALLPEEPRWRRHLPAALYLVAVGVLALALARPEATVAVPVERASVVLVMDASRSMLAEDVDPTRLEAARRAAGAFLDSVPDELRVGAVGFSTSPHTLENPTTDHDETRATIDGLTADGGTATGEALAAALAMLEDDGEGGRRPPAAIVLLSDGRATVGPDPFGAAREARRLRVPIYTVALGTHTATVPTPGGGLLPVPPDPETLKRIAQVSGGSAFTADDADELDTVYERLGSRLGTKSEKRELTAGFAGGGIVLLLAAAGLSLRQSGRLP
jgi:Ca-activated chloride channel family protein